MEIQIKLPTPHNGGQEHVLNNAKRFNHLRCGRRWGKTALIKELTSIILEGKSVGIWYPTYKDGRDVWEALKNTYGPLIKKKDETNHMIWFKTNVIKGREECKLDMWAMENPESGQGFKYDRAIIDEFAKMSKDKGKHAWENTIRATLSDYSGDAWVMSRPRPNTEFSRMEEVHKGKDNWIFHHYTSYDNPHLPDGEVDEAKKDLDPRTFEQEYLAEYVDPEAHYFLYAFEEDDHIHEIHDLKDLPIKLSFDFNLEPFAVVVYQTPDKETLNVIEEIRLNNSDIYQVCDQIKAKYPDRAFQVTGDKSGYNRTGTTRGKTSYWQIIKKELSLRDYQIRLRAKNLDLLSSRILCNSGLYHKDIAISPNCVNLIRDCKYAIVDERGELVKDRRKNQNDFLDCFRYALDCEFPTLHLKSK